MREYGFEFGYWATQHRVWAHLLVPALANALLVGFYFSGIEGLQQIVAPTIEGLPLYSWREFGLLEMLQNLVLLILVVYLARSIFAAGEWWLTAAFALLAAGFFFVLLEEIDYGLHFLAYFGGAEFTLDPDQWSRNLHNRATAEGVQYGSYMKMAATATLAIWFLLAPFLLGNSRSRPLRLLVPTRWAAATVVLIVVLSRIAHLLDSSGLSWIDGSPGNLEHNISEFRELNMYYLFLLYFAELLQRLRNRHQPGEPG
jgi:hypothetical protein